MCGHLRPRAGQPVVVQGIEVDVGALASGHGGADYAPGRPTPAR